MAFQEQTLLTPVIFALLLALHDGPRHGYALMADVAQLTDGAIRPGPATLYRSLQRMQVDDLIEEIPLDQVGEEDLVRGDRRAERRRRYRITPNGRVATVAEAHRLAGLVETARRLGVLGEPSEEENRA